MRCQDHIVEFAESVRFGDGLILEAIQRRSSNAASLKCLEEGLLLDNPSSRGVQEIRIAPHQRKARFTN